MTIVLQPQDVPGAQAIIRRLCQLQHDVVEVIDPDFGHAADCFCGESGYWPYEDARAYRNAGLAIDFIVQATRDALARLQEHT